MKVRKWQGPLYSMNPRLKIGLWRRKRSFPFVHWKHNTCGTSNFHVKHKMASLMNENKTFKALNYNKAFWHFKNGNFQNFHNKSKLGTPIRIGVGYFFYLVMVLFLRYLSVLVFFFWNVRDPSLSLISIHVIILHLHSFHV